jgi:scyllo-inositol 2-dehydrogenase (NADP+)
MGIKTVVVGLGMGKVHAREIRATPGLELVGVCDTSPHRRDEGRGEFGVHAYERLEEVLADERVQLVVLAVPHHLHTDMALASMAAKKHTVLEKPFCMAPEEGERMIAARNEHGVLLSIHHQRRWDADFFHLREWLADEPIGPLFHMQLSWHAWGPMHDWRATRAAGGGIWYDLGAHLVDQANLLAGSRPRRVFAVQNHAMWHQEVETFCHATITYESGLSAVIFTATSAATPMPRWYLLGERGAIRKEHFGEQGEFEFIQSHGEERHRSARAIELVGPGYYASISAHLNRNEPLSVTAEQALDVIRVLDAANRSAASGDAIDLAARPRSSTAKSPRAPRG